MFQSKRIALTALAAALGTLLNQSANAAVSLGVDAGTLGVGPELQFGLSDSLAARVGFTALSYSRNVTDTGIRYDGTLKLSNGFALLEWHTGGASFKASFGAVVTSNKIDITGVPSGGNYQLGNSTYPASNIGSITGAVKAGNGLAPYVGIGFGHPLAEGAHLTFLFDIGLIFTGSPKVSLTANCSASVPAQTCTQIRQDAAVEVAKLEDKSTQLKLDSPIVSSRGPRW